MFVFVRLTIPLDECDISFCTGFAFIRVNDFIPLLQAPQFFLRVAQHLFHGVVTYVLLRIHSKDADPDLGILEYRTEKLLTRPHLFLSPLSLRNINNRDDSSCNLSALKYWERGILNRD